jgi:hypothetical protein
MTTGMHLTKRDRAMIAAQDSFSERKARLDEAIAAGNATAELLESVQQAQAHVTLVSDMPMTFTCALGKGEAKCEKAHVIYHVIGVTFFNADVVHVNSDGEEVRGAYQFIEYDKARLRKLAVCGHCNDKASLHEHLFEGSLDQESDPRRSMGVAIGNLIRMREEAVEENKLLLSQIEAQRETIEQLGAERRELRLRLSGVAIGGGEQ